MQLSRAVGWATTLSTGLGVSRWSRWLATMGIVAVIGLGVGVWAGARWERGAQALSEATTQRGVIAQKDRDIKAITQAAEEIRLAGVNAAQDYRTAALRLETIANAYDQQDRARNRAFSLALDSDRAPLLRDRADLWDCDIGQQLLDHWNRASAGPDASATPAAAADSAGAAGAVRADAAGQRQPGAGADPDARSRDGDRARLRGATQPPG